MDDRRMELFLAAVKTGSFSKAAGLSSCSQSAVTQSINKLEEELGCRLIERNHNGIKLTSTGEQLLPFFLDASASLTRLANQAELLSRTRLRPIRIGSFSSIATQLLPELISRFKEQHPDAAFEIRVGTNDISTWLMNNEIDLGFGDEHRLNGHAFQALSEDPYYAVLPSSFPAAKRASISLEMLLQYPFIMASMNDLRYHLKKEPVSRLDVICDDDSALLAMVAKKLGVTIMPQSTLKNIPEALSIIRLEPAITRRLGFAAAKNPNQGVRQFVQFIMEVHDEAEKHLNCCK